VKLTSCIWRAQHYLHHAISVKNKPYHTGFFFKLWDQLFGSMYKGECFCVKVCFVCWCIFLPLALTGDSFAGRSAPVPVVNAHASSMLR
jgi:hypothetical protein